MLFGYREFPPERPLCLHLFSKTEIVEAKEAKDQAQHEPPSFLQHLTIGINKVTQKPESQIKSSRQTVIISDKCTVSSEYLLQPRIKVIFVCHADIHPPILVDHLNLDHIQSNSPSRRPNLSHDTIVYI